MANGIDVTIQSIVRLIRRPCVKMSQYFPKSFGNFGGNIVKVALSNYATKTNLKNITHINTSSFALKPNLASLNIEVGKLGIDKLAPVPIDLGKLNDPVRKIV